MHEFSPIDTDDMHHALLAKFVSLDEDDESFVFVFSADECGAGKYVMFQYPLRPDEQDRRLGQDGLYIECDDQSKGCYRGVESIRRVDDRIEIDLNAEGRQALRVQRIYIEPTPWTPAIDDGLARLAALPNGEYRVAYT